MEKKPIVAATKKSEKVDNLAETVDWAYSITRNINGIQDTNVHKCTQTTEIASIRLELNEELNQLQLDAAKTSTQVKALD